MKPKVPASTPAAPTVFAADQMDYQDYLKVAELVSLQQPLSDPPHHDEMLFIIIHQAFELWFRLMIQEMEVAIGFMGRSEPLRARHFIKRIVKIVRLLTRQIHVLETMRPVEFLGFRDHLKPASGFQSRQFREIEFLAGLKDPAYIKYLKGRPDARKLLENRLDGPDLGSAFLDVARTAGLAIPAGVDSQAARSDAEQIELVAKALVPLYTDPDSDSDLYQLSESLIEFDECFSLWRHHHVNVVERIIGRKRGTGGSEGVAYLKQTTSKRCFPYLWSVRTHLGEDS